MLDRKTLRAAAFVLPLVVLAALALGHHRLFSPLWDSPPSAIPEEGPAPGPGSGTFPSVTTLPTARIGEADKQFLMTTVLEGLRAAGAGREVQAPDPKAVPPTCRLPGEWGLFVTLYAPGKEPLETIVQEKTLADSAVEAVGRLARHPAFRIRGFDRDFRVRIKIDVLVDLVPLPVDQREVFAREPLIAPVGAAVALGKQLAYVLPGEAPAAGIETQGELLGQACAEAGLPVAAWTRPECSVMTLKTIAIVNRAPGSAEFLDLVRGAPLLGELTAQKALSACLYAGNYLASGQSEKGRFRYLYIAATDQSTSLEYPMGRHFGACWSLYRLYGLTRFKQFRDAADRGVEQALDVAFVDVKHPEMAYVARSKESPRTVEIGATAMAAVALLERRRQSDSHPAYDPLARKLLAFLLFMQDDTGRFDSVYSIEAQMKSAASNPEIALQSPGQAALALAMGARILGDAKCLDGAERALDYLSQSRDLTLDPDQDAIPPHDAFFCMAAHEMAELRPKAAHALYAWAIARSMARKVYRPDTAPAPDFVGGQSTELPPSVSGTALALEGYTSAFFLMDHWAKVDPTYRPRRAACLDSVQTAARFVMQNQLLPESTYFAPSPERALGGFRSRPTNTVVRIDTVQHALGALAKTCSILDRTTRESEVKKDGP